MKADFCDCEGSDELRRQTSVMIVYEKLRELIWNGELVPGDTVVIAKISRQFGISTISVREAVKRLAIEGYLISEPFKKAIVAEWNGEVIKEIYSIRLLLEVHATKLAIPLLTSDQIRELQKLTVQIVEFTNKRQFNELFIANLRFHGILYGACKNNRLFHLLETLWMETRRANGSLVHVPGHANLLSADHQELIKAIEARDVQWGGSVIERHVKHSLAGALEYSKRRE